MGVFTGDIADLFPIRDGDRSVPDEPLGTRLRRRARDDDVDAVEAVRELRERR